MNYLVIDTVTDPARVIVVKDETIAGEAEITPRTGLSETLLATIDGLLEAHNLGPGSLTKIGIVNKPASFTSLRISLSVVNALSFSLNLPVVELASADLRSQEELLRKMSKAKGSPQVFPDYGRPPRITRPT